MLKTSEGAFQEGPNVAGVRRRVMSRKRAFITKPRVFRKIAECHFFLREMERRERYQSERPEEFGYNLSAFLSALRSVEWFGRLVVSKRSSEIANRIGQLRQETHELDYLLNAGDAEVHREGVSVILTLASPVGPPRDSFTFPSRRPGRKVQGRSDPPPCEPPSAWLYRPPDAYRWSFEDTRARAVVQACRIALEVLERLPRDELELPPNGG
jgi:hypothetical protein